MLCRVAFFTLLVLSLVQEDSCYSCADKSRVSQKKRKILDLSDNVADEVNKVIHRKKYKKLLESVKEKLQDKICATKLDADTATFIRNKLQKIQRKLKKGAITNGGIISFLEDEPLEKIEEYFFKLFNRETHRNF
ncbi:hypothetical protein XELAEV_18036820mg [Xenopus laevis]|uniref:Uncharacterized protein n=1 Tax=Xenopus laevis TaxID=8355 RepID=A0A974CAV4_XENLA|nr:hypothetical protein XELAEV_18036820mg [Xenopus laevis]